MSRFAEFRPERPADAPPRVTPDIRAAVATDVAAMAALGAARDGGPAARHVEALHRQLAGDPWPCALFVAHVGDVLAGYARASRLGHDTVPQGWYLAGVVVAAAHRRRGVGRALTEHRLAWLAPRAATVWYFANELNLASARLHADLGFREVARGITVPGCAFEGGAGVLFRRDAAPGEAPGCGGTGD